MLPQARIFECLVWSLTGETVLGRIVKYGLVERGVSLGWALRFQNPTPPSLALSDSIFWVRHKLSVLLAAVLSAITVTSANPLSTATQQ